MVYKRINKKGSKKFFISTPDYVKSKYAVWNGLRDLFYFVSAKKSSVFLWVERGFICRREYRKIVKYFTRITVKTNIVNLFFWLNLFMTIPLAQLLFRMLHLRSQRRKKASSRSAKYEQRSNPPIFLS